MLFYIYMCHCIMNFVLMMYAVFVHRKSLEMFVAFPVKSMAKIINRVITSKTWKRKLFDYGKDEYDITRCTDR